MGSIQIRHLIGERIRDKRREKGLSQEELAERADIHSTYIGQLERGEKSATVDSLEKITAALGITFEELFIHLQPSTEFKDNTTICRIINKLNTMGEDNQKVVLNIINALSHYKPK